MRFEITQNPSDNSYSYEIINDAGTSLFVSDSFATREACTGSIEAAVQVLGDPNRYVTRGDGGLTLVSTDGTILARNQRLPAGQTSESLINDVVRESRNTSEFQVTLTTTSARPRSTASALRTLSDEELAALYNFARQSSSGATGFELFQSDQNQQHYFHFNDADGNVLLYSRGFSTAGQRDKRLASVIQSAARENRFEVKEEGGRFYFILKARNGQEIARSRSFASRSEAIDGLSFVNQTAPSYADQYAKKKKRRDTSGTDDYLLNVPSPENTPGFVSFKNPSTKRHYFHLNDADGNPVLYSQGYTSGRGRDNGIRSVIKNSVNAASFVPQEENGTYHFAILAGNRQEIARSRSFSSAASRDEMIAFLLTWVRQYATSYGVSFDSSRTSSTETFTLAGLAGGAAGDASGADEGDTREEESDSGALAAGAAIGAGAALGASGTAGDGDAEEASDSGEEDEASNDARFDEDTVILAGNATGGDGAPGTAPEPEPAGREKEEEEAAYATADDGGGGGWLRIPMWLIGLLLLLLLLFLLRGCIGCTDLPQSGLADSGDEAQTEVAEADNTLSDDATGAVNMAGSGSSGDAADADDTAEGEADAGTTRTLLGPDALALGFAPNSLEAQIANLLSGSDRTLPASFVMDKVAFPSHSAKLNKSAYDQVDNLVKLLKAYPNIVFEFVGHIDGTEDENSAREFMNGENITLSAVRARCLVKKFEEQAISSDQLDYSGLGATQPLANNTTESNRQTNRRLELVVRTK